MTCRQANQGDRDYTSVQEATDPFPLFNLSSLYIEQLVVQLTTLQLARHKEIVVSIAQCLTTDVFKL